MIPASEPRTVVITGATGALGPAVVRRFEADDWRIRTLSRKAPAEGTPAAAHPHVAAEITDIPALTSAFRRADAVVHMAALLHVLDPAQQLTADYRRINVGGTEAVLAAARAAGVPRVVVLSTIAVYGPHDQVVDETTPPAPDTPYGTSKLEAEQVALAATSSDGRPLASVLRLSAVYGPTIKGNYERLVRALARGRFIPVGDGRNLRTLVHEEDAAEAICLAAAHPAAAGTTFNVSDGTTHAVRDIVATIAAALGRAAPRFSIPAGLAAAGIRGVEGLFRMLGHRPPVTRAALDKYLEHVAVRGDRIRTVLGFQPRRTLEEGWRRTIADMRREGTL
jgi:UDP-glucose 4-epimerase